MINVLIKYTFLRNAVIGAILASIVCGIIGTIIVEKKLIMMSGGIAHTSFGGIGIGYFLKIEPIIGALFFSVFASLSIATIKNKTNTNTDTLIGIFWSVGMAIGILFVSFMPGYPPDMTSYLFGNILTISTTDIKIMLFLDLIIVFIITSLFEYFKGYLFDEEFTAVLGIKTVILEYLLFILIALTIVVLIRMVGIILVIALLTIPPAIAKLFTFNLKRIMVVSIFLGIAFSLGGLFISHQFNIASGASIVILGGLTYIITICCKKKINVLKY